MGGVRRLGILGGTFDPVHLGHLILGQQAQEQLALDRVLFVPAAQPWRKSGRRVTPPGERLEMVRLAVADNPLFEASSIEIDRGGPSYTADTLEQLRGELPDCELYFIAGQDALEDLPFWKGPDRILRLARVAVAARPGHERRIPAALRALTPDPEERVVRVEMPLVEISGTLLRERARRGLSLRYFLPPAVEAYVRDRGLYRDP